MSQRDDISAFEEALQVMLARYPHAVEPIAFAIRRASPEVCGVLTNLAVADRQNKPFPALNTITAMQCTVFDNWPNGTKPKTVNGKRQKGARAERFKIAVELWTDLPSTPKITLTKANAAFSGNVALLDGKKLATKLQKAVANDRSEEMMKFAESMMTPLVNNASLRCGYMTTVGNGTHMMVGTYATADDTKLAKRDSTLVVTVHTPHGPIAFKDWSTMTSSDEPLKGNAVMTCRWSSIPQKRWWSTAPRAAA